MFILLVIAITITSFNSTHYSNQLPSRNTNKQVNIRGGDKLDNETMIYKLIRKLKKIIDNIFGKSTKSRYGSKDTGSTTKHSKSSKPMKVNNENRIQKEMKDFIESPPV